MSKKESNICKGFAVILMLLHHLFYNANDLDQWNLIYGGLFPNYGFTNIYGYLGKLCVSIFVFITGYGTAKSYIDRNLSIQDPAVMVPHTAKRYWKLLTSFWAAFLFAVLLSPVMSHLPTARSDIGLQDVYGPFSPVSVWYFLVDFMGLSNLLQSPTFNGTWWYMSFALMLVVMMPFLFRFCRKFGWWALVLAFFLIRYLNISTNLFWYLLTVLIGVLAAQKQVYERLNAFFREGNLLRRGIILFLCGSGLLLCYYLRWKIESLQFWDIFEAVHALLLGAFVTLFLGNIPLLSRFFAWIGRHSMNIFLTHSLLFYHWLRGHIYSPRYPLLILALLLAESLALSIILELLKKLLRWDLLMDKLWKIITENKAAPVPEM